VISLKNTFVQPHAGVNRIYRNTGFLPQLTLCCLLIGFLCFNSTTRSVLIHDHIWKGFVNWPYIVNSHQKETLLVVNDQQPGGRTNAHAVSLGITLQKAQRLLTTLWMLANDQQNRL
jgi:hypothetical protein